MDFERPDLDKVLPRIIPSNKTFWEGLKQHRFQGKKCKECGKVVFPPSYICAGCFSRDLEWIEFNGKGKLYAFTRVHVVPRPYIKEAPLIIGVVRLEEGPLVLSWIKGDFEALKIDMDVKVIYERLTDEVTIFKFEPL